MSGVNKAIVVGFVGKDPEVKSIDSGMVANFSVATSESWKGKDGNKQERTEWHRVVAWGKLAEIAGKYLVKGKQVYVEGRLQTRKYQKNGQDHYSTEIVAQTLTLLGKKGDGQEPSHPGDDTPF